MKKLGWRSNILCCVVMAILCALLCLLPPAAENAAAKIPREKVEILSVDDSSLFPVGIVYSGVQGCDVRIASGAEKGRICQAFNYLNSALDKDKLYQPGDIAWAMVQGEGDSISATLIDHYRGGQELWIVLALALALIVFGGFIGAGAVVSLAASTVIVWKLLIPLLLRGINPVAACFVTVVILTGIIDLLVAGFTRRCLVAFLGSIMGTCVTCAAALAFTGLLKLDGGDIPYVVPLLAQSSLALDPRALFIGMTFLANSGALMDLSMDLSVSCQEIARHRPDLTQRELLKSGCVIGRGVLGTMTTTLMLAYSGNYLSMLMYFAGQGTPAADILNLKYVASQFVSTLAGSFGLVIAAPLSALIASFLYTKKEKR